LTWTIAVLVVPFLVAFVYGLGTHTQSVNAPPSKVAGTAESAGGEDLALREASWAAKMQERVRTRLKDPDSAQFRNVRTYRGSGIPIACGEVNSKNGFGGYTGFQGFVAAGYIIALEEQTTGFADVRGKFCRGVSDGGK
jgi:hypothetical protein